MLYNVADMDKPTTSEDRDTAAILEGSQLCCSCQLRDMVHCLGGMAILLPLVRTLLAHSVSQLLYQPAGMQIWLLLDLLLSLCCSLHVQDPLGVLLCWLRPCGKDVA